MLLIQAPFELGDTITVTGLEGRVEDIQTRATIVMAPNGHRLFIPNTVLFTNPVGVINPTAQKEPVATASSKNETATVAKAIGR